MNKKKNFHEYISNEINIFLHLINNNNQNRMLF